MGIHLTIGASEVRRHSQWAWSHFQGAIGRLDPNCLVGRVLRSQRNEDENKRTRQSWIQTTTPGQRYGRGAKEEPPSRASKWTTGNVCDHGHVLPGRIDGFGVG